MTGIASTDYIPNHQPFQKYASTANPHHLPTSSIVMIGRTDAASLTDFWNAANAANLPAVSFLEAAEYLDGHPLASDPLDEQMFLVDTINRLQSLPGWESTAVIITYADSGGWYDHVMPPIVSQSSTHLDALSGSSSCGTPAADTYQGRCYLALG